jgi:hypothetical protein
VAQTLAPLPSSGRPEAHRQACQRLFAICWVRKLALRLSAVCGAATRTGTQTSQKKGSNGSPRQPSWLKNAERWAAAEMHRLRGMLLLSTNEHEATEDSLNQALAVACGMKRDQSSDLSLLRAS